MVKIAFDPHGRDPRIVTAPPSAATTPSGAAVSGTQIFQHPTFVQIRGDGQISGGSVRTASLSTVTGAGSVAAGARSVAIANAGTAPAQVAGSALAAGGSVEFTASDGDTLSAISYDATGTSLQIAEVR